MSTGPPRRQRATFRPLTGTQLESLVAAQDTIEEYVLDILDRKLNMFELVIGEMDMILGQIEDERDFEDLLVDAWLGAQNAEVLRANFDQLGDKLVEARTAHRKAQEYDEALFGEDFSAD